MNFIFPKKKNIPHSLGFQEKVRVTKNGQISGKTGRCAEAKRQIPERVQDTTPSHLIKKLPGKNKRPPIPRMATHHLCIQYTELKGI